MHYKQADGLSEMCLGPLCTENHCVSESFKIPLPTNWQGLWRCPSSAEKGKGGAVATLVKSLLHTYEDFEFHLQNLHLKKGKAGMMVPVCNPSTGMQGRGVLGLTVQPV